MTPLRQASRKVGRGKNGDKLSSFSDHPGEKAALTTAVVEFLDQAVSALTPTPTVQIDEDDLWSLLTGMLHLRSMIDTDGGTVMTLKIDKRKAGPRPSGKARWERRTLAQRVESLVARGEKQDAAIHAVFEDTGVDPRRIKEALAEWRKMLAEMRSPPNSSK